MSGVVAIWRRDGSPVGPDDVAGPVATLAHRGPDGHDAIVVGCRGIAHQHFWTTPEEVGERQPTSDPAGPLLVALDGRLDNRSELFAQLAPGEAAISDAALLARAYERWGEGCFARLLGPFAACVFDQRTGKAILARDPLGDRTLFYHLNDRLLVAASEAAAVLAHRDVPGRLNGITLARLYAVEPPGEGATLFADVREVPPGHVLVATSERSESRAFWQSPEGPALRLRSDREYAEAFRELLRKAVLCRMRSPSPAGVLMSGGLDSTSVACLAAQELARTPDAGPLRVFSWVFDKLACDERRFMDAVIERHGLEAHRIVGDDLWPLQDASSWPRDASRPAQPIYRLLHQTAWRKARALGTTVLLTGGFGDHLYSEAERWLLDLLEERRVGAAVGSLLACLARRGPNGLWRDPGLRGFAGLALRQVRKPRPPRTVVEAKPWITPEACEALADPVPARDDTPAEIGGRFRRIASPWAAFAAPQSREIASRYGVEIRNPYRDRRLVEFMASVPSHQVYRGGLYKHILREAMKGILPDRVRLRRRPTSYMPLYNRGFFERERETVRKLLADPDAWWPRFVRREWLENAIRRPLRLREDGVAAAVPWLCVVIELWRRTASPAEQAYLRLP